MNKRETIDELDKLIDKLNRAIRDMPRIDDYLENAINQLEAARHTVDITKESVYNQQ